jgi:hypothetical protein
VRHSIGDISNLKEEVSVKLNNTMLHLLDEYIAGNKNNPQVTPGSRRATLEHIIRRFLLGRKVRRGYKLLRSV